MTTLTVTSPLFALVFAGFMAFRSGLIGMEGIRAIANFAFYFALPVLMFQLMSELEFGAEFNWRYFLHWSGASVVAYGLGMTISRIVFRSSLSGQCIHGMAASFGNMAIIGLPIIIAVFGPEATLPITMIVAIDAIILMPLTIIILEGAKSGFTHTPHKFWRTVGKGVMSIIRNPILMGLALGSLVGQLEVSVPNILINFIDLAGAAGIPCALFALGGSLAQRQGTGRMGECASMIIQKLCLYPIIMVISLSFIPDLDPIWWATGVLAAGMPMGANLYLIAEAYNAHVGRASLAVLISTLLSLVSVTVLAGYLASLL